MPSSSEIIPTSSATTTANSSEASRVRISPLPASSAISTLQRCLNCVTVWSGTGTATKDQYRLGTSMPIHTERMVLNGATVIDGPELIWADDFKETWGYNDSDGYHVREWAMYDQYQNTVIENQSSQADTRVFSANFAAYCVKNTCRAAARLRIFALSATKLCSKIHIYFL